MKKQGYNAVSAAMVALTIISVLLILISIHALMISEVEIAVTLVGIGIGGFILRGILKGFRSIVEACELYVEHNTLNKDE